MKLISLKIMFLGFAGSAITSLGASCWLTTKCGAVRAADKREFLTSVLEPTSSFEAKSLKDCYEEALSEVPSEFTLRMTSKFRSDYDCYVFVQWEFNDGRVFNSNGMVNKYTSRYTKKQTNGDRRFNEKGRFIFK